MERKKPMLKIYEPLGPMFHMLGQEKVTKSKILDAHNQQTDIASVIKA
jgi:hypothetical protein